jgi:alpha-mannosidase
MKKNINLAMRYAELKKKVGGNREKQQYEHTMFHVKDQMDRITPPSTAITRILSQVQFALELSRANGNKYDTEISDALDILESGMDQESVLTKSCCLQAEECLFPLKAAAKAYQVIYVGHAHIDMNWKWLTRKGRVSHSSFLISRCSATGNIGMCAY